MSFDQALDKLLAIKEHNDVGVDQNSFTILSLLKHIIPSKDDLEQALKLSSTLSTDSSKPLIFFVPNPTLDKSTISSIAAIIHIGATSSYRFIAESVSPFKKLLQVGLNALPTVKARKTLSCSFVIPPGFVCDEESCEKYLSETFSSPAASSASSRHVLLDSPVIFTTSTNNTPSFLGSSPNQPALIYRIVHNDNDEDDEEEDPLYCFNVSKVIPTGEWLLYVPTFPLTLEIERSVKIGKKFIVTLRKKNNNKKPVNPQQQQESMHTTIPFLPPASSTSLVASNIFTGHAGGLSALAFIHGLSSLVEVKPNSSVLRFKNAATDEDVAKLGSTSAILPLIEGIDLTVSSYAACPVTDGGIKTIATTLGTISTLNLYNCSKIGDRGLHAIGNNLVNLTWLNLDSCKNVTDSGVRSLAKLDKLTYLNFADCSKITDSGVQALANLTNLTYLNLSFCDKITDLSLQVIASKLVNLTSLNVSYCDLITDGGKDKLKKALPNLKLKK